MKLEQMPRYPLLCGFTPLQRMENLEQALGCGPLYIKRDDLTPLGLGGNKTRKLEFLLGDALAGGADTLVTVGGVQTNHGRLTAAAAAKAGLACTLVLDGAQPEKLSGNLLLDCLLGASLVYTDGRSTSAVIEETLAALQAAGRAPYFIPEGGSNAVGSAGYLAMVPELLAQAGSLPVPPARLVCTMGSLGTFAGLWLGARAFGAPFSVTGVAVNPTTGYTREKAAALVNEMSAAYGLDIAAAPQDMDIIYADAAHDYAGPGYNVPDAKTRGPWSCWPARKAFFWTRAIRPSPSGAFAILRGNWTAEPYLYIRAARPLCGRRSIWTLLRRTTGIESDTAES